MSVLSDRLRQLRGETSQSEFASALGMKQQQYARYEKGIAVPGADILANICRIHAASSDWLLGLDRPSNTSAIASGKNSIAVCGNNPIVVAGESPSCSKCPYKKKLKQLEKVLLKA